MKWQPIAASLVVIALFMGGMAVWRLTRDDSPRKANNAPANAAIDLPVDEGEWKTVKLRDLPSLDPIGLWPSHGARVSDPQLWVVWETREHASCRVIARSGRSAWYEVGSTKANTHYMALDLSRFNDEAWFCVEWTEGGREYRSQERLVSFGAGTAFGRRTYRVAVPKAEPAKPFDISVVGGEFRRLTGDAFLTTLFPDNVHCWTLPRPDLGVLQFGVTDPASIPDAGCFGFLEVRDPATGTVDRVLIELRPV
ncbi:MAG: hypothetical protein IT464_15885 [Planctomycetes bacterium]|nr:hypothetical protein [Planctomycetota bacterium]